MPRSPQPTPPSTPAPSPGSRRSEHTRFWVSAEAAQNRIIVRTVAGGAAWVANLIDQMALPEVLGTIAGNDSVAIICSGTDVVPQVLVRLRTGYDKLERGWAAEQQEG